MTWLPLLRLIAPYAIIFAIGFGAAWQVQGLRVTAAKQDLTDYKQAQVQALIEAEKEAERRRKETADDYQAKLDAIGKDHETYKRCVAAGKCGARVVRVPVMPGSSGLRVPAPGGSDEARPEPVPAAGEVAAEDGVLKDCARTTLQLNQLQEDIEKQWGR